MNRSLEQFHRDVISGADRSIGASMLRGALRLVEPLYAGAAGARNACFARGIITSYQASRPVISVGNITTGGTGKTPVVRWLATRLRAAGRKPAILLRGYKGGDEQRMLQAQLPDVRVEANPSRVEAITHVLNGDPQVDVFVLDDGFQHRQLRRDFDLVLIDASNPFGFGHVLPRGLLREPLRGLRRASSFLLTHAELVDDARLGEIESALRRHNPGAPAYRCEHALTRLLPSDGETSPNDTLAGRKVLGFCGIGNPDGFRRQLQSLGAAAVEVVALPDHHGYTLADLTVLGGRARQLGADALITTEKDWVKLAGLVAHAKDLPPIWRMEVSIRFRGEDETRLFEQIMETIVSLPAPAAIPGAAAEA